MPSQMLAGLPVEFPHQPYHVQFTFMTKVPPCWNACTGLSCSVVKAICPLVLVCCVVTMVLPSDAVARYPCSCGSKAATLGCVTHTA